MASVKIDVPAVPRIGVGWQWMERKIDIVNFIIGPINAGTSAKGAVAVGDVDRRGGYSNGDSAAMTRCDDVCRGLLVWHVPSPIRSLIVG